jgi:hypothetical protein
MHWMSGHYKRNEAIHLTAEIALFRLAASFAMTGYKPINFNIERHCCYNKMLDLRTTQITEEKKSEHSAQIFLFFFNIFYFGRKGLKV